MYRVTVLAVTRVYRAKMVDGYISGLVLGHLELCLAPRMGESPCTFLFSTAFLQSSQARPPFERLRPNTLPELGGRQ